MITNNLTTVWVSFEIQHENLTKFCSPIYLDYRFYCFFRCKHTQIMWKMTWVLPDCKFSHCCTWFYNKSAWIILFRITIWFYLNFWTQNKLLFKIFEFFLCLVKSCQTIWIFCWNFSIWCVSQNELTLTIWHSIRGIKSDTNDLFKTKSNCINSNLLRLGEMKCSFYNLINFFFARCIRQSGCSCKHNICWRIFW